VYRSVLIPLSVCHDDTSFAQGRLRLKCTPIPQDLTYHSPAVLTTAATAFSYWQYHDTSDMPLTYKRESWCSGNCIPETLTISSKPDNVTGWAYTDTGIPGFPPVSRSECRNNTIKTTVASFQILIWSPPSHLMQRYVILAYEKFCQTQKTYINTLSVVVLRFSVGEEQLMSPCTSVASIITLLQQSPWITFLKRAWINSTSYF
jgi:hypothetical protein